jgi:SAM-dependent methyltransferase
MNEREHEAGVIDFVRWNELMFQKYGNERLYHHPNPLIRLIQRRRVNMIVRLLQLTSHEAVLDAGTGEGYLFSFLPPSCLQIGVDLSATALDIAQDRNYPNVHWVRADLAKMPFPDEMFDKLICSEVIEHVPEPHRILAELYRVLKPAGKLVLTIPHEVRLNRVKDLVLCSCWGRRIFPNIPIRTEWHLTDYSPKMLLNQLSGRFSVLEKHTLPYPGLGIGFAVLCVKESQP